LREKVGGKLVDGDRHDKARRRGGFRHRRGSDRGRRGRPPPCPAHPPSISTAPPKTGAHHARKDKDRDKRAFLAMTTQQRHRHEASSPSRRPPCQPASPSATPTRVYP
jgi:hypothetical protein